MPEKKHYLRHVSSSTFFLFQRKENPTHEYCTVTSFAILLFRKPGNRAVPLFRIFFADCHLPRHPPRHLPPRLLAIAKALTTTNFRRPTSQDITTPCLGIMPARRPRPQPRRRRGFGRRHRHRRPRRCPRRDTPMLTATGEQPRD